MSFTNKARRKKEAMGRGEDRISSLPDPILQYILTMMPLKSAIRTDVLSKKWQTLWQFSLSSATALEFGEDFASSQSAKVFVETVNRYLSLNNSNKLEMFRVLFCPFDLFSPDIERWISYATGKGVNHLDIDLSQGFRDPADGEFTDGRSPFELPASLFDCDSLTKLSLTRCNFSHPLNLSNFGTLQSLSLSHCNINENMLQCIFAECPLLESLSLRSCQQLISILLPGLKLKRLTIGDCWSADLLEIDAPKLQSFHYFGGLCSENNFLNTSSLEDASIYSINRYSDNHDYVKILSDLSHVQILTLCSETLLVLINDYLDRNLLELLTNLLALTFYLVFYQHVNQSEQFNPQQFPIQLQNLQEMQLLMNSMAVEDLTCIYDFFHLCPSQFLEKLFIHLPKGTEDPNDQNYGVRVMLNPREATFNHLEVMKVINFKGSINEMRLISFFLERSTVLESLVLVLPPITGIKKGNVDERLVLRILRGQVSLLPKASPRAQITVYEFGEDDGINPTHADIYNDYSCLPVIPSMVA